MSGEDKVETSPHPAAGAAAGAGGLLDRPLPPGYRAEWARHFAGAEAEPAGTPDAGGSIVIFRIGAEWLALSTELFQEVAEPRRFHSLPHRRDERLLGIVNVRGELVVCVSLSALLGIGEARAEAEGERIKTFPRLVVIGRDGRRLAFPADEVHGIHRPAARDLAAVPATIGKAASRFTHALVRWKDHMVGRLDDGAVLDALDRSLS